MSHAMRGVFFKTTKLELRQDLVSGLAKSRLACPQLKMQVKPDNVQAFQSCVRRTRQSLKQQLLLPLQRASAKPTSQRCSSKSNLRSVKSRSDSEMNYPEINQAMNTDLIVQRLRELPQPRP